MEFDPLADLAIPAQAVYYDAIQTPTVTSAGGAPTAPDPTPEAPGVLEAVGRNVLQRRSNLVGFRRMFGTGLL